MNRDGRLRSCTLVAVFLLAGLASSAKAADLELNKLALTDVQSSATVSGLEPGQTVEVRFGDSPSETLSVTANEQGIAESSDLRFGSAGHHSVSVHDGNGEIAVGEQRVIPGWVSLLPPFFAITLALVVRSVIPALVFGIWVGAMSLVAFSPKGAFVGLLDGFQVYVLASLADRDHASIILFTFMIGGMVGIVTRVGGMAAIVTRIVSRAKSAIAGQVAIWMMGLIVFFDDYGNTLVVGNTARPISDHLRISREKLAYIVDSTAAPVATIAVATTWIGYQVGLIQDSIGNISQITDSAYSVFLHSIAYSFYPVFAILFVLAVGLTGRDFGPMAAAELRAKEREPGKVGKSTVVGHADDLEPKPGIPGRAVNAVLPILTLVIALFAGLFATGEGNTISEILGSADAYMALMWASLLGVVMAGSLAMIQRLMSLAETMDAWYSGARAMLFAMITLVLAWALSGVTQDLHTAEYLVSILAGQLPLGMLPLAVFVLSALTAFSTGTAWGTMGILMPLIIPLTWAIMMVDGNGIEHMHIMYSAIACNLAGAVWGDHCSPISDTTVLSSMASGCDHIEHVRTQLPYALVVGAVAALLGTLPSAYGIPWWACMLIGMGTLIGILFAIGKVTATREPIATG